MTKDQTENAATWFERHMPPMPGARAMYQTAVEALRTVGQLQAEKAALLAQAKDTGCCEVCAHFDGLEQCPDGVTCAECPVDCYCKDCTGACKWEWRGIEVAALEAQRDGAVTVVRCRECIYKGRVGDEIIFCNNFERDMMLDDFCSLGEQKDGAE